MASEHTSAFDASTIPQLADLVEEVRRTRTRKPIRLRPDGETVAYLDPASPEPEKQSAKTWPRKTSGRAGLHGRRLSRQDSLWNIVGIANSGGPGDVAENVDKYLAEAYADIH